MTDDRLAFVEQLVDVARAARGFGLRDLGDELDAARSSYLETVRTFETARARAAGDAAAGRLTAPELAARLASAEADWQEARHALDRVGERVIDAIRVVARDRPAPLARPPAPMPPPRSSREGEPTIDALEAERRRLASHGQAHGWDTLARPGGPFAGQRTTIRRRYKTHDLGTPGDPIEGICETASEHPHPR